MDKEDIEEAIEVLEDANDVARMEFGDEDYYSEAINALRQALVDADDTSQERVDEKAKRGQEPVAWAPQVWRQFRPDGTLGFQKIKRTPNGEWEDYSDPPKAAEWVGLTDEERSYYLQSASNVGWWQAAKMIEAKLKEKNGGEYRNGATTERTKLNQENT